ncbi:hypothetical protein AXG93_4620s1320 [Marchantia polymorpha subsp. ruderalis]|uniref:Uncharacterized protein n=1 Tax=Marchantia polymorpha subsp. ruderalis TaxID=1480154 RepID=A0A176VWX5_MARPO|nr:hypothetical protein AXG93_4620s1320 [Marchantia polymorpha subsp. ruderalis]
MKATEKGVFAKSGVGQSINRTSHVAGEIRSRGEGGGEKAETGRSREYDIQTLHCRRSTSVEEGAFKDTRSPEARSIQNEGMKKKHFIDGSLRRGGHGIWDQTHRFVTIPDE